MSAVRLSFVLGADWSSRLIAWYGQGVGGWSHVDAVLPSGELLGARSDTIKGVAPGVQIRPPGYEKWKRRAIVEVPVTPAQATEWERWLRKQVGRQYDNGAIWSFIIGGKDHEPGHWICSACQFEGFEHIGLLQRALVEPSQVTPDALFFAVTTGLKGRVVHSIRC